MSLDDLELKKMNKNLNKEQTILPGVDLSEKLVIPRHPRELFPLGCFKNKPRPEYHSKEVKGLVLEALFPNVIDWLESEGESFYDEDDEEETEDLEGVRKQLSDVLDYHSDGFEMAHNLKNRHCWECNDELVGILKSADFYSARQKAVLAWMRDNDIKPKLELGSSVKIKLQAFEGPSDKLVKDGIIVQIRQEGEYVVAIPEMGHNVEKKCGRIVAWEELEKQNDQKS
jgi:hypothetical protein